MRAALQDDTDSGDFVLLPYPPLYDPEASQQQEHQRVQVDFKPPDDEPDANCFIIRRDHIGSMELLDSFTQDEDRKVRLDHFCVLLFQGGKGCMVCQGLIPRGKILSVLPPNEAL